MTGALARLEMSLDGVEGKQRTALNVLEESYNSKMRRMRGVFADLGLDMAEMEKATPKGGVGGPFVPFKPASTDAFDRQLFRITVARAQIERLSRTLSLVPYRKPVIGEIELSSGFGVRSDPFLGRPAMHTGLDFRASTGDPVRVTANGTVTSAGWSGGYGRMIEVDHGNGLSTRYGHLSEILVKVGDNVKIGQVIGAVGSTGRSTGPHLHYETRIDGDAVDPQKFLRAGVRLTSGGVRFADQRRRARALIDRLEFQVFRRGSERAPEANGVVGVVSEKSQLLIGLLQTPHRFCPIGCMITSIHLLGSMAPNIRARIFVPGRTLPDAPRRDSWRSGRREGATFNAGILAA